MRGSFRSGRPSAAVEAMPPVMISAMVFLFAAALMIAGSLDISIRTAILRSESGGPEWADAVLRLLSKGLEATAAAPATFVLAAGVGAYIAIKKQDWRPGVILIGMTLGVLGVSIALKALFDRPGPLEWAQGEVVGRAFPSGHAALSLAVWGYLAYLWRRHNRASTNQLVAVCLTIVAFSAGVARLVLDVHWFTDVLSGWALGCFFVSAAVVLDELLAPDDGASVPRHALT
jgi:membrane-associated phospholipid phosphatase